MWPLGEGAAKPGIEMARRDIMQQKRKEQDESQCREGWSHKADRTARVGLSPLAPFSKGDAIYEMCYLVHASPLRTFRTLRTLRILRHLSNLSHLRNLSNLSFLLKSCQLTLPILA